MKAQLFHQYDPAQFAQTFLIVLALFIAGPITVSPL